MGPRLPDLPRIYDACTPRFDSASTWVVIGTRCRPAMVQPERDQSYWRAQFGFGLETLPSH
jgi:hypothetical protein